MELSGIAKRAMELVERVRSLQSPIFTIYPYSPLISQLQNLSILYGAHYFTEEEWIKFDSLLHKGRYVLSDGPASNILDAPLMTFEESKDDIKDTVVEIHRMNPSAKLDPTP